MKKYKFVNNLDIGAVLIQTIVWLLISVITFGLASPFFAYYFVRLIINHTEIHEIE
jgi:uncharacterized membrane protein YjgN (DUF898 family)